MQICEGCSTKLTGRQSRFCSDKCRMQVKRTESQAEHRQSEQDVRVQSKANTPAMHERQCQANNETRSRDNQHTVNAGKPKPFDELDKNEHNRVSLPGDDDYDGVVTEAMINGDVMDGVRC